MAVTIEVFEDWGTGGATRTAITNANLKTHRDPAQHYFLNELRRPMPGFGNPLCTTTHKRHIFWKCSSATLKANIRIKIAAPTAAQGFKLFYGLTNTYSESQITTDAFGKENGVFDGKLIPVTSDIILYPRLSATGPTLATSRLTAPSGTVYTEYLVLQAMAMEAGFDAVDNYGAENISLLLDELES